MRTIPPAFAAHLNGQATSTCRCWRLTRKDGTVLGFTDHDEAIRFEGTVFEAAGGLSGSEAEAELGLAAGTQDVDGALSSLAIRETDIAAGRYDGAKVESFVVNWEAPDQRLLVDVHELGEVKRAGSAFTAELRGIAARLDRQRGRFYRRRCDAVLGDGRCKVDLSVSRFRIVAQVATLGADGAVVLAGAGDMAGAVFAQGRVEWTSGEAAGLSADVVAFRPLGGNEARVSLLGGPPDGLAAGDEAVLRAGCDKSFATCRNLFANELNFRGFPHLPGNDTALAFAKKDGRHDGSPVVP